MQRQHPAGRLTGGVVELLDDGESGVGSAHPLVRRVDVASSRLAHRQPRLLEEAGEGVLIGGQAARRWSAERADDRGGELARLARLGAARRPWVVEQCRVGPQRGAVGAPEQADLPARQGLAGIPLALAAMLEPGLGPAVTQAAGQRGGEATLVGSVCGDGPLGRLHVLGRDVRRLATHRQAYVALGQPGVHRVPESVDALPLGDGVGPCDARVLMDAADGVGEVHGDHARVDHPRDRRRARGVRRRGQRDVALSRKQSRGRVEADPAGARQIDLRPGVQVGEVLGERVGRTDVRRQLHEIARHEPCCQPELAQHRDQQPRRVPAGSEPQPQRLLRALDACLETDGVGDVVTDCPVERYQEVDDRYARTGMLRRPPADRGVGDRPQIGLEVVSERGVIAEREGLGTRLDEEVEGVDDGQLGDQVDLDAELGRALGEHQPCQVVAERVLLPVEEVVLGCDLERVGRDRGPGVWRRPEPDHMRPDPDEPVEGVGGPVVEGHPDRHAVNLLSWRVPAGRVVLPGG